MFLKIKCFNQHCVVSLNAHGFPLDVVDTYVCVWENIDMGFLVLTVHVYRHFVQSSVVNTVGYMHYILRLWLRKFILDISAIEEREYIYKTESNTIFKVTQICLQMLKMAHPSIN